MSISRNFRAPHASSLRLGSVDLAPVLFLLGVLLATLGGAMLGPAALDFALDERDWPQFLISSGITVFCGLLLVTANSRPNIRLELREGFLLTALSWLVLAFFGGLPFLFANDTMSFSDAIFESVSGLTSTGATVLVHLETQPSGVLLWRALLQWIGGIGIIGMAITLLPALRVGGMQLFRMESSDTTEHGLTRFAGLGVSIITIYLVMTIGMVIAYMSVNLSPFEAVCLAMSTVSTGGFATTDASAGNLPPLALWFAIGGMLMGSLPYILYVRAIRGRPGALISDPQVRGFLGFLLVACALMTLWRWTSSDLAFSDALTSATFAVTSVVTTTGLVHEDYTQWGSFAFLFFFLILFSGGCTGSTTGGIKMFRFQVAFIVLSSHIRRRYLPNAVVLPTYGGRPVDDDVAVSVTLFFFALGATTWFFALVLAMLGLDWLTALSGAMTTVCNVGPGVGDVIGPQGNFASLSPEVKWVLATAMIMGRLELFTMLVLLDRRFWRA